MAERRQAIDALLTWWNMEIYAVLPRGTRRGADGRLHLLLTSPAQCGCAKEDTAALQVGQYTHSLGDEADRQRALVPVIVKVTASHIEIVIVDARGKEIAAARVEQWNSAILAQLWDAESMARDGGPQTIVLGDLARGADRSEE